MAFVQVLLATVDVAVTAAIFYALLPAGIGLNYPRFLGVYLASYSAGLAANLPGGLGVFDTAMLLGLAPYLDAAADHRGDPRVPALLLHHPAVPRRLPVRGQRGRAAWTWLAEGRRRPGRRSASGCCAGASPISRSAAATGAVALCGALLLSIGVLAPQPDFSWIDPDFAEVVNQAGQFIPSLIGAALMVLSVAMSQRVTLAWGTTIVLLLLAAAFLVAQGEHLWDPARAAARDRPDRAVPAAFYRHARLITGPLRAANLLPLFALVVCVLALAAFEPHVRWLSNNSFWEVILSPDVPNSLARDRGSDRRAGLAAMWRLLRPTRVPWLPWNAEARLRYAALGGTFRPRRPMASCGVKPSGPRSRSAVSAACFLVSAIPRAQTATGRARYGACVILPSSEGLDPAVWRAGRDLLKIYADLGLAALPLDADGVPRGDAEDVDQPHARHYLVCVAERDLPALLPLLPMLAERVQRAAAE